MSSIPALTGIRALAAGAVFFGHILHKHIDQSLPFLEYGWIGVNMFFALSGYLFFILYVNALENNTFSWRTYLAKRFIRIYPLTILIVLISWIAMNFTHDIMDVLSHLALIHGVFPQYRFSINPPLWTLTIEMSFYLIAPLLIFSMSALYSGWKSKLGIEKDTSRYVIASITILIWMISVAFCNGMSEIYQNWWYFFTGTWDSAVGTQTIFGKLDDFMAGMAIAAYVRLFPEKKHLSGDIIVMIGTTIIILALLFTSSQGGSNLVGKHKLADFVFPSLAFGSGLIIMGLHRGGFIAKVLSTKTMVLLGEISFGLYVLHYISIPGYPKSAVSLQYHLESLGLHFIIAAIICYITYSLLAFLSLIYFEKPIGRYLTKRLIR
jgi:peptidoglycan/LPS O-acetylase OafA/YrhL